VNQEIQQKQTFEERMMDKIRESIGDLMTQEELKKILERGVEKALFESRQVKDCYGGYRTIPSVLDEAVSKFLQPAMDKAVSDWIDTHQVELKAAVDKAVQAGAGEAVLRAIDSKFYGAMASLESKLRESGVLK